MMSELSDYLHRIHQEAGLPSTRILGGITGMSHSTIALALNGQRMPSWSKLERIVSALGGSPVEAKRLWMEEMGRRPRFIRVTFERGISDEDYDKFSNTVMDLAEATMANYPSDCDNEIWVSGGGATDERGT